MFHQLSRSSSLSAALNLSNLPILNGDPKLNRLTANLAVFNVSLAAGTDIHENVEVLAAVRTHDPTGLFHMPLRCTTPAALKAVFWALGVVSSFQAQPAGFQATLLPDSSEWIRWIESVRQRALEYTDQLPDFICTQVTRRYAALEGDPRWYARDSWEAELSYNQKNERYSQLRVNGKATSKPMESLGGAFSIGEFGSILRTLFLPETRAQFWKEGEENLRGIPAVVAGFKVEGERSNWTLSFKTSHSLKVPYQGKVWVDARNQQVLRISQHTLQLPPGFPIAYSETTTEYDYLLIPGVGRDQFLLPKTADFILRERQPAVRSRSVIEFQNYRKFVADVRLAPD